MRLSLLIGASFIANVSEPVPHRLARAVRLWSGLTVPRRIAYPVLGMAATVAAPLGLLLVRLSPSGLGWAAIWGEVFDDRATFLYLTIAAMTVCVGIGAILGYQADKLLVRSTTDELTTLDNRWAFERRLDSEIARSARYGRPVSVLLIDLDGFKSVNDRWGHLAGDRVLRGVGLAIRGTLRSIDQGARLGGDEFAIVAPDTAAAEAWMLGHRVLSAVKREACRLRLPIAVSVGLSTFASDGSRGVDRLALVNDADAALYEAKRRGGNCVQAARQTTQPPVVTADAASLVLHSPLATGFRHFTGG